MKSIIKFAAPNVVPGMNFKTERFEELFAWISANIADNSRSCRDSFQYGLLSAYDGQPSLELLKNENRITLHRCIGITPGGRVIGVIEGITPIIEASLEQYELNSKTTYHILIQIHGLERSPFGPNAEDLPERPQFTMPAYRLHIQDINQDIGNWAESFPIGVLEHNSTEWIMSDYIPPCAHLAADPILSKKYIEYQEAINALLIALPNIVRQTDSFRDKAMIELRELVMQAGSFISCRQPAVNALTATGQPFQLLEVWLAFAYLISFQLNCLSDRPGFYNLIYQNTRSVNGVLFTTTRLEQALDEMLNHSYNNENILKSIHVIDEFLAVIVPMFKALGNGTLRPTSNTFEEVYKPHSSESESKTTKNQSHLTW